MGVSVDIQLNGSVLTATATTSSPGATSCAFGWKTDVRDWDLHVYNHGNEDVSEQGGWKTSTSKAFFRHRTDEPGNVTVAATFFDEHNVRLDQGDGKLHVTRQM